MSHSLGVSVSQRIAALERAAHKETYNVRPHIPKSFSKIRQESHLVNRLQQRFSVSNHSEDIYSSCSSLCSSGSEKSSLGGEKSGNRSEDSNFGSEKSTYINLPSKMPADQNLESSFTTTVLNCSHLRSKSSDNFDSDVDSLGCGALGAKRLSLVSHSDYETCGSLTSLDDCEDDARIYTPSAHPAQGNEREHYLHHSKLGATQSKFIIRTCTSPTSDVSGYSDIEDSLDFKDLDVFQDATKETTAERPKILERGLQATLVWLRDELTEMRKTDQSLMLQFMDIQKKINSLKQEQQYQQQQFARRDMHQKSVFGDGTSELLGNHRFSWELGSLDEEDEYDDYDTEDELEDD